MRSCILSFILCFSIIFSTHAQDKTVYMSIDVSASMKGDKYNLANYTVQMITALMEEQDELYFSICSDYQKINTNNKERQAVISSLQKPFNSLNVVYLKTEIGDIKAFMQVFRNRPDRDQWFFIVGDGYWHTEVVCDQFKEMVSVTPINVWFLETMEEMDEHGHFGYCLDDMPFISQYRSSDAPQTIINNCITLATSLFGVSNESATIVKESDKCYTFTSEIPVKKVYIVYQDEVDTKDLPTLEMASSSNKNMRIARQSTVSTDKMRSTKEEKLLSGQIIVLDPETLLAADKPIKLCFNKSIDPSKLKIYPMVDIHLSKADILTNTGIPQTSGNETVICLENDRVKLVYELLDSENKPLPASILEKTVATIKTDEGEYTARLNNGIFECEIPLAQNELNYTINAQCSGYFNLISDKKKIKKSDDCTMPVEGAMRGGGGIHIKDLMNNDACISVQIVNSNNPSEILNPQGYDISIKADYRHLFKDIRISNMTSEDFELCLEARNALCECFIPDEITLTVYAKDKVDKFQPIQKKLTIKIDKSNTSKLEQCKWIIIIMIGLLLLIIYLRALSKKKRFKKGAMVRYQYFGVGGIKSRENVDDLRSKGFFSWLNRWFIPSATERSSKSFAKANNRAFSFSATTSNQRIEIPKTQYDPKLMSSIDFDRDQYERRDNKSFTMSDNTNIKITLPNGTGSFQFCYDRATGSKDDVPAFKAFTSSVLFLAVAAELVLIYLFVTSLF